MLQNEALDLLKLGKNVFLTGAAGSGKTYVLNKYIDYLKRNLIRTAVTASTGIAATHLQGMTIHSWSGIGVKDYLDKKDLDKIAANKRIKEHYEETKVLIIDEISMLHPHQLEMVNAIAQFILNNDQPFGGMQIVLCGDFFQLPPVSSASPNAEKNFAFECETWEHSDFYVCYLHEQHRQGDDPLLSILNDIRNGTAGEHTKIPLRTRYKKEPASTVKATKLYSRNMNVDTINDRELRLISSEEKTFDMLTKGNSGLLEGLKRSCLAAEKLRLKVDAEVMFIKNDPHGDYVNGTRGVVTGFDKSNSYGWPIVKTFDGKIITAFPEEWKFEDNGKIRATISQVPLRLAWAITIHKSQGMTLDAVEIDLGDAFEPGMGYVALSRVRKLDGLKLMNLNDMALRVHPKILEHDEIFKSNSDETIAYLQTLTEDEITKHQQETITKRFCGGFPSTLKKKKKKE